MKRQPTDLTKSLDELQGCPPGDPASAPTSLVADILRSRAKPLNTLQPHEIGQLVVQRDGMPFILDLVFPLLEADPLYWGGYYEGDVLANLIRASDEVVAHRPEYGGQLSDLYRRALDRPDDEKEAFIESLELPDNTAIK